MVCPECGIELVGVGGEERESEDEETFPKTQSDFDEDPTMATWGDEGEGDLSLIQNLKFDKVLD